MRRATKSVEFATAKLFAVVADEYNLPQAADDKPSAATAVNPAVVADVGLCGDAPRKIGDYKLELIQSREPDGDIYSKRKTKSRVGPDWLSHSL